MSSHGILAETPRRRFAAVVRCVCQGARQLVGVQDYATYVEHRHRTHPEDPVMSQADYFRACQDARYGAAGKVFRCC